jgi:RNA polymerase sigma-70 factor (ECF subfamily)
MEASGYTEGNAPKMLEERANIQNALGKLPENYREVLLLRFAEDLQFNEIAELTNQNLEATKSLYRRAISALRNLLEE